MNNTRGKHSGARSLTKCSIICKLEFTMSDNPLFVRCLFCLFILRFLILQFSCESRPRMGRFEKQDLDSVCWITDIITS